MLAAQKLATPGDLPLRVRGIESAALDMYVIFHNHSIQLRDAPADWQSLNGFLFLHGLSPIPSFHQETFMVTRRSQLPFVPSIIYLMPVSYGLYFYLNQSVRASSLPWCKPPPSVCFAATGLELTAPLHCTPKPPSVFHNDIPLTL